jgi:hypothetical protein
VLGRGFDYGASRTTSETADIGPLLLSGLSVQCKGLARRALIPIRIWRLGSPVCHDESLVLHSTSIVTYATGNYTWTVRPYKVALDRKENNGN